MAIGAELTQALRNFARLEHDIVDLGQRVTQENAVPFVRMRRALVMGFAELGSAIENDPWLQERPEELQQTRQHFAAFRTANSINQANWPVIMARDDPAGYKLAAQPVAERSRAFWQWVDAHLGFKR